MKKSIIAILCICLFVPAFANDTTGQLLPTGEIRFMKQPEIRLQHEALLLSYMVTVDYLFENTSDKQLEETVFFPIPTAGPLVAYYQDPHDFDFNVWIDGQRISTSLRRQITLNGKDVTKYFDLMGIDAYDKALKTDPDTYGQDLENAAAPLRQLPAAEQQKLEKIGMLAKGCEQEEDGKCTHNPHIYHLVPANYQQEVMYYWIQTFPPHKTVHIRHTYTPSFFSNSIGQPTAYRALKWEYEKPHDTWKAASYIVTTANNWQTPIGKFNLLVWGEKGAAVSAYNTQKNQTSHTRAAAKNYILETKQDFLPQEEILFELAGTQSLPVLPRLYRIDGPANLRRQPNGKKFKTLSNGTFFWAYPSKTPNWYVLLADENTTGFIHRQNLVPFGE